MNLEELVLPLRADVNPFKASLTAAIAAVTAVTAAMGLAVRATFKWADELDSIQDVMGVTNRAAAALNFTLRKSGTATEALTRGMVILEKGLVKADGKLDTTGKALKSWGIDVLDVNGKLKDQESLIDDVGKRYAEFATQQERVNFLTEVFGRSGAELVDFFDTLAAEGGIDSVTKKVQALGLAIDPNRYEQFNRSLEELKLIGLGLAVSFTEKVMPALEGFLGWFTSFAADPDVEKLATKVDNFIANTIQEMTNGVNRWIAGNGPKKLSEKIVSWVEDIGTGQGIKSKALTAAGNLLKALAEAAEEIDWSGIAIALDAKLSEQIGRHDWQAAGDSLGDAIETMFSQELTGADLQNKIGDRWALKLALPGIDALVTFFETTDTGQAISNAVASWFVGLAGPENLAAFDTMEIAITEKIRGWPEKIKGALDGLNNIWNSSGMQWANLLVQGLQLNIPNMYTIIAGMEPTLGDKLGKIAKTFFNTAQRWTAQMIAGFKDGTGGLLAAISDLVGQINAILKKIKTNFSLGFSMGEMPSGTTGGGAGSGGGGSGLNTVSSSGGKRASGGPVIAGQTYSVAEFFKPEVFTPNVNGRVDPMRNQPVTARLDDAQMSILGNTIATNVVKALNNI